MTEEQEKKIAVVKMLNRIAEYLGNQTFGAQKFGNQFWPFTGYTMSKWITDIGEARELLGDAALRVASQPLYKYWRFTTVSKVPERAVKTPLQKSVEGYVVTPDVVVVVIDGDRLEREVLKGSIKDSDVQKLLPFQTVLGGGHNHVHVVNLSAYTVETNSHFIRENETLCARADGVRSWYPLGSAGLPTCPGCLVKAKNIIVNHLYATEGIK